MKGRTGLFGMLQVCFCCVYALFGEETEARKTRQQASTRAEVSYLSWLDGGCQDSSCLEAVVSSCAVLLKQRPAGMPTQAAMQAFCRVLRLAEESEALQTIVRRYFPHFGRRVRYAGPDRQTGGDWPLFYGSRAFCLAGYGKISDLSDSRDGPFVYRVRTGDAKVPARYWQPKAGRDVSDPSALVMPASQTPSVWRDSRWVTAYSRSKRLFQGKTVRRASWWDDHGEMHPFDDAGPNLQVDILTPLHRGDFLSLYMSDYDWRRTPHPRQQSVMLTAPSGEFLNACWSGRIDCGVYERFEILEEMPLCIHVLKHRGACVALNGVFVDSAPWTDCPENRLPVESASRCAFNVALNAERTFSAPFAVTAFRKELDCLNSPRDRMELFRALGKCRSFHPVWQFLITARLLEHPDCTPEALRKLSEGLPESGPVPFSEILQDAARRLEAAPPGRIRKP